MATSIVIRTKNEAAFLGQTLEAIYEQEFQIFEIIVVDSGSTDGTLGIVRQFDRIKLIEIKPNEFTYGRALNVGVAESMHDIVVFLSAHAVPASTSWLSNFVQHFNHPMVAGVYGRQLPHRDAYPPVKVQYLNCYKSKPRVQTSPDDHFFSNANAAIRRSLWRQFPFDEEIPYCEDQIWAKKILSLGYRIIYEPEAAVYHSHNESLSRVYKRSRAEEQGFIVMDPKRHHSLRAFCEIWLGKVVRDIKFIRKNKEEKKWLFITPIYRLFDDFGRLRPHLPQALWLPFQKRIRLLLKTFSSESQ